MLSSSARRGRPAADLGIVPPPVRPRDGATLAPGAYEIRVGGVSVATGEAPPGHLLAIGDTPDLLPGDITGMSIYNRRTEEFEFRPGPVFANVVIADEINRASPKTQSALLECMAEHQVTVDGLTHHLPEPFFCVATQNPHGQIGTFPLPESQLDRFALVLSMGLPDRAAEREILTGRGGTDVFASLRPVADPTAVAAAVAAVRHVHGAPAVVEYVLDLAAATRTHPELTVGVSPRATVGLLHAARAHAVVSGRAHLTPDDVQAVAGTGDFSVRMIPSMRMLVDMNDFSGNISINSTGQSGHPKSPWYGDMIEPWRKGTFRPMLWTRQQVDKGARHTLVLRP